MTAYIGTRKDLADCTLARLYERIDGYNAGNCYYADEPVPKLPPQTGRNGCTVAFERGQFDSAIYAGGGRPREVGTLVVSPMARVMTDKPGRDYAAHFGDDGLVSRDLIAVMCALLRDEATEADGDPITVLWMPHHGSEPLLVEPMTPLSIDGPFDVGDDGWQQLQLRLQFQLDYALPEVGARPNG